MSAAWVAFLFVEGKPPRLVGVGGELLEGDIMVAETHALALAAEAVENWGLLRRQEPREEEVWPLDEEVRTELELWARRGAQEAQAGLW